MKGESEVVLENSAKKARVSLLDIWAVEGKVESLRNDRRRIKRIKL